jgi:circadian clock protein KaiC
VPVISAHALSKAPTGIQGLDEITGGGLPQGRPTLVCGGAGSGKSLLAMSFLINGVRQFGEPGVLMSFEENVEELATDVASLGFDVPGLMAQGQLLIDYVRVERSEIEETGEYDLQALFLRLDHAIRSVGARRVVLDTPEALFEGLSNVGILRAELRRLFRWLRDRQVTTVITGERGGNGLTRHGLEEYVTDAVILLDHRVSEQVSTRRLRVVKYRGSYHGTNEYPFLIGRDGLSVWPITSLQLNQPAPRQWLSSGTAAVDQLLAGRGFYRGSTVLISGSAGTGKTTVVSQFIAAACRRGERCLFVLFEESPQQLIRNMASVGIDLQDPLQRGLLRLLAHRPTGSGLESHLQQIYRSVSEFSPQNVVLDPVTNLVAVGNGMEVAGMLTRLIDHLKSSTITALFTTLVSEQAAAESGTVVSSLMDTWVSLTLKTVRAERHRYISVVKARGTPHSNRILGFELTEQGLRLLEPQREDLTTAAHGVRS